MKLSSLDDLNAVKKKFPAQRKAGGSGKPKAEPGPGSSTPERNPADDADVFSRAMSGVEPLGGVRKGREVQARPPQAADVPPDGEAPGDEGAWVRKYLHNLVRGDVEFQLSYSEEYIHGHVQGLDLRVLSKLKAGRFSLEAHLDMHGLNAAQARAAALEFLRSQYHLGRRCVLLIPGRGRNSPGGQALIREELPLWLTREPLRRVVMAFCTALPQHGGAGALYVLLRKFRKETGKVRWDLPASTE